MGWGWNPQRCARFRSRVGQHIGGSCRADFRLNTFVIAKASEQSASATADCHPDAQAGADALTIPGVGHLTTLAFTAAVDHPEPFVWSALTVARFTMI